MKAGFSTTVRGRGYIYRQEWFGEMWHFNGPGYELVVDYEYSDADKGTGYSGPLSGAHIVEGRDKTC